MSIVGGNLLIDMLRKISYNTNNNENKYFKKVGKEMLDYISKNYVDGELIQIADIPLDEPASTIRWKLKQLTDEGKLIRVDKGIYCLPKTNRLGMTVYPSAQDVATFKYIERGNIRMGYYTGVYFANQIGITTQLPFELEIVTNEASNPVRKVKICEKDFTVRKSMVEIDRKNYRILQLFDLLKNFENYNELGEDEAKMKMNSYIRSNRITKKDADMYLPYFPDKIYRNIYRLELFDAFTH